MIYVQNQYTAIFQFSEKLILRESPGLRNQTRFLKILKMSVLLQCNLNTDPIFCLLTPQCSVIIGTKI